MKIFREDSQENVFFNRQLEYILPSSFDVKYAELLATTFVPVDSSAGPGAEQITWRQYDKRGVAKFISNYATDFPRAEVTGTENISKVKTIGNSFGYNLEEMRAATFAASKLGGTGGRTLDQRRADAAMRGMLKLQDDIIFSGDASTGLGGFINNAAVTASTAANPISSASTPDQILAVLNLAVNGVVQFTNGVEQPSTLLMPVAQYNYIASTARSSTSDTTILNFFLHNNPYCKSVKLWPRLTGQGVGATDLMVAYTPRPDLLAAQVPSPVEVLADKQGPLEWDVKLISRQGGVIWYYPLSANYVSGV